LTRDQNAVTRDRVLSTFFAIRAAKPVPNLI